MCVHIYLRLQVNHRCDYIYMCICVGLDVSTREGEHTLCICVVEVDICVICIYTYISTSVTHILNVCFYALAHIFGLVEKGLMAYQLL